jgi:1-pyrroline-5-carboxylate dehydrogenase
MAFAVSRTPAPRNEPIHSFAPGSPERESLKAELLRQKNAQVEIPMMIGGKEVTSGEFADCRPPHEHGHLLGKYHRGGTEETLQAIAAARAAKADWAALPWEQRASIFLRAADLLAGSWRDRLNAATMLAQSKNCFQAEIDAACELIDFFRFNVHFAEKLYGEQPQSGPGMWNRLEHRPLEGFVFAVTPFNFTSIAGNLPTSAALMGNTVVWKPASSAVYSAQVFMELMMEAGLPPGVINMVMGRSSEIGAAAITHEDFAGVHFTGSTAVFQGMWKSIGENIAGYKTYPRIVGETGGKDFIFVHESADADTVATAIVRGSFEYQGQKCSASSRVYAPKKLWGAIKEAVLAQLAEIKMGNVEDFGNFVNAVIDKSAFQSIKGYVDFAKEASDAEILVGGGCDDSEGYFIEPTVIETTNPHFKTMEEEIFGPVVTIYPYDEDKFAETLELCDSTSPYALTGAIIARDRYAVEQATSALRNAAGNFYINDKPTGAVVGQQPFGGARASGTNDKAGSILNLQRWVSPRAIKETFEAPRHFSYPFLG